jgi:hypothetical protein
MPVKLVEQFFLDLDQGWNPGPEGKINLLVIGSGALFLQTDYERGTKDSDVLETPEITLEISERLRSLAGRGSPLFKKHRVFLDIVRAPIPFLPQMPIYHDVPGMKLKNFSLHVLDIVDVVVSKLKPFRPRDVEDIEYLVSKKLIPHKKLVERFEAVIDYHSTDARAEEFPKFVKNLNQVERMMFVPESKIELPDWI